jgi:eukaryotic-like serine/threonine-protein kinase
LYPGAAYNPGTSMPPLPSFGPYQILSKLGEGGMGEVYRARDTTLNREVALKVLPESVAGDPDRLARFRREAQVLASLNHPNIAHIHGFEQAGSGPGATFGIIMELVEGPTLADRIEQGPIASADAWPIARQIADALEAAHDLGIVHRDLKPANIKVRDDGTVKVLDFGLAKALDPTDPSSQASISNSPTLTARATQMGMILGTAAYMAPEQARGRAVDRRADIWAFGVVLYEMLSGRRAFEGEDISITLAGVLKEDVKWDALPVDLPASIRRLLRRCLEKDPKRRLGAISDARLELDEATGPSETAAAAVASGIGRRERLIWASLAMVGLAVAAGVAWTYAPQPEVAEPVTRFGVLPPGDGAFTGNPPRFAISPDGQSLVFAATLEAGKPDQFWLRRLDSMEVTPVPGTESGNTGIVPQSPFWSPNGRHLAFFVQTERAGATGESRLRTVDLQGGVVQTVCDLPSNNAGGSWNADGVMLVASQESKGIQRVPATGGVPTQVTTLDASRNEVSHRFPQFLPDGRHFIYQVQTTDRSGWAIFVGSIDSGKSRMLVQSDYARFAAPHSLLYVREGNLFAQTMDAATQELTGDPVKIASGVYGLASNGRAGFAASDNGVLVYRSNPEMTLASAAPNRQLTWVDRTGKPLGVIGIPTSSSRLRLSPEADRVALLEFFPGRPSLAFGTLWVADLGRGVKAPLTSGATLALSPSWSATGDRVLFGVLPEGGNVILQEQVASGATPPNKLYEQAGVNVSPIGETTDGQVLFTSGTAGVRSLQVLSRATGTASTYLANGFDHPQASLSPDGKWLAYVSNESGAFEIIVQPFPDPLLGKWPISTNGGSRPRWRHDGRELFYVDSDDRLVAVPVATDRSFVPGKPTPLFTLPTLPEINLGGSAYVYDVAPGGQRFLVSVPTTGGTQRIPLIVTTNWTSLLKK